MHNSMLRTGAQTRPEPTKRSHLGWSQAHNGTACVEILVTLFIWSSRPW